MASTWPPDDFGIQVFLAVSLFKLVNAIILAFSFVVPSLNHSVERENKGIVIRGNRQPDLRGDKVAEIFSRPTPSSACVESCCWTLGLPAATHSIQGSTTSTRDLM